MKQLALTERFFNISVQTLFMLKSGLDEYLDPKEIQSA